MIAIDTNALIRLLIEDDQIQAKIVRDVIKLAETHSIRILVLTEVLIETVWVLESVYDCDRKEISGFLENLTGSQVFALADSQIMHKVIDQYKKKGDFSDLIIVNQAKSRKATNLFSFDLDLQKAFPKFVVEKLDRTRIFIDDTA